MKRFLAIAALFALAVGTFVAQPRASSAQYPPPAGSITSLTSSTNAAAGDNVTLTCVVRDESGIPVAGAPCTFTVVSEPGGPNGDVAVGSKVITKETNAQGIVTTNLYTGTTPGTIVVSMTSGELASTVLVTVGGQAAPAEGSISPPSTGDAGLAGS